MFERVGDWVRGEAVDSPAPGGACGPAWHHPLPVEARLEGLRAWLKGLPHESVVIVGHSMVFDKLLGLSMKNCELVEHEL